MSEAAPFWQGCAAGELRLLRCEKCAAHHHFAPRVCPHCGARALRWIASAGTGRVASFTIVHRAPSAALKEKTPYVLALIDLDEGARLMARVRGDAQRVRIGAAVRVCFEKDPEGRTLPAFELV